MSSNERKKLALLIIAAAVFILSACNGQSGEPTIDPDSIYTAAAQTVEAQLTQAAEQNPSPTFTQAPPTETLAPAVEQPTSAAQTDTTPASQPGQPVETSTPLVLASFTASPPPPSAQAKYELVSQDPGDGAVLSPNYKFDMTWTIKNTGTETWTELYTIQFFLGDRISGGHYTINQYNFREAVEPGDTTTLIVDMMTPSSAGEYYSWWKLKDEMGNNFGDVDVTIVVSGPTKTATP